MAGPKKKIKVQYAMENQDNKENFVVFADALLENVEEEKHRHDPLEAYIGKLRMHFYSDSALFSERFKRGYHILLEELQKK